jgi:LysR family carnitine catabolism transcriptional activator
MNLTQRQLQLFTTTAVTLNLSRAAERLHLSQPAFTRALQALEAQLGVRLFERSTRQMTLTADGQRFLPAAQRLLDDLRHAVADLQGQGTGLSGRVALALGSAFGGCVLPAALSAFGRAHPAVRVQLLDDNSQGITARVVQGEVDFGIGSVVGAAAGLVAHPLLQAPLGLLAHPAHHRLPARPSLARAQALPLVKEAEDTSIMQLLRSQGSPWAAAMEQGVEVSSLSLQLSLVQAGLGVAVLSALGASHPQASGLSFVPFGPRVWRQLFLLHRRDRPLRPAAQALAAAIQSALRQVDWHPSLQVLARQPA